MLNVFTAVFVNVLQLLGHSNFLVALLILWCKFIYITETKATEQQSIVRSLRC